VKQLCTELLVSRSGYYDWCTRQTEPGKRAMENTQLRAHIRQVHEEYEQVYGSPRIALTLQKQGVRCGRHRVARLMRYEGLRGRPPRRFRVRTTDSNHAHPIAPNRLQAMGQPTRTDQVWVSDITYVETAAGWLYLAAVMDLFSRRIIGWATARTLETSLVLQALQQALATRRPNPGLIVHSDRGVQYASTAYRHLLAQHRLLGSMSRKANCYDNAVMEAFWSTLKLERLYRLSLANQHEAHRTLFQYIEGFYNSRRLHSSLAYRTPLDFESLSN
jgi:transposase InsO family protein